MRFHGTFVKDVQVFLQLYDNDGRQAVYACPLELGGKRVCVCQLYFYGL